LLCALAILKTCSEHLARLPMSAHLTYRQDLIAAQTQTLDALKTHKQGLMQQLFPAPVAE
jgi:hypothetical protein